MAKFDVKIKRKVFPKEEGDGDPQLRTEVNLEVAPLPPPKPSLQEKKEARKKAKERAKAIRVTQPWRGHVTAKIDDMTVLVAKSLVDLEDPTKQ